MSSEKNLEYFGELQSKQNGSTQDIMHLSPFKGIGSIPTKLQSNSSVVALTTPSSVSSSLPQLQREFALPSFFPSNFCQKSHKRIFVLEPISILLSS